MQITSWISELAVGFSSEATNISLYSSNTLFFFMSFSMCISLASCARLLMLQLKANTAFFNVTHFNLVTVVHYTDTIRFLTAYVCIIKYPLAQSISRKLTKNYKIKFLRLMAHRITLCEAFVKQLEHHCATVLDTQAVS